MLSGSGLKRHLNYQLAEVNEFSNLDGLIYFYPRSSYQPTKRSIWHQKSSHFDNEEEALVEKIVRQRLAQQEALTRRKINQFYGMAPYLEERLYNSDRTKVNESRIRSSSYALSSSDHKRKETIDIAKRPQSTKANNRQQSFWNKNYQNSSLNNIFKEKIVVQASKQGQRVTKSNLQLPQMKTPEQQNYETKQKGTSIQNSNIYEQLKYLKQQLEQKNRKIVDLECKILKQQNGNVSYNNLQPSAKNKNYSVGNVISISINSPFEKKKLQVGNQFTVSVQKIELKQARETKDSFFATTSDMKNFNIQDYQLKQTMFLNGDHLVSSSQNYSDGQVPKPTLNQYLKLKISQKNIGKKQSLTQSIVFQGRQQEEIDLTLSSSQVCEPARQNKFDKKMSYDDDLTLLMSQNPNFS